MLRGRTAQGGSTITQQVVKTMLLSPERTLRRKVQEIILARQLSQKLSKEEVLALYLNQIYYGHGRYGCEEAARYYFGKSVRDVNLAEAALLAGLPQSPERLSPRKHPDAAKTRQRYVLGQLAERGFIDRKTADKVAAEPIRLAREPLAARGMATETVDSVGRYLGEHGDVTDGITVQTTLDARFQELARASLERGLEDFDARQGFRGPSGHLTGKALDKRHAALAAAHKGGPRDGELIEGLVTRVEAPAGDVPAASKAVVVKDARRAGAVEATPVGTGAESSAVDLGAGEASSTSRSSRALPRGRSRSRRASRRGTSCACASPRTARTPRAGPRRSSSSSGRRQRWSSWSRARAENIAIIRRLRLQGRRRVRRPSAPSASRARRAIPVGHAAALESLKLPPATIIDDAPIAGLGVEGRQYEKESFAGPIRARVALAESKNTVAVKVLNLVGIPAAQAAATRFGITTPLPTDAGLALALGVSSVKPIDMANVLAFASSDLAGPPVFLQRGRQRGDHARAAAADAQARLAYVMTSMLRNVVEEELQRARRASRLLRPRGQNGTTNRKVVVGGKAVASGRPTPGSSATRRICWPPFGSASTSPTAWAAAPRARRPRCRSGSTS